MWMTKVNIREHSAFHITLQCAPGPQPAYQSGNSRVCFIQNVTKNCPIFRNSDDSTTHCLVTGAQQTGTVWSPAAVLRWPHAAAVTIHPTVLSIVSGIQLPHFESAPNIYTFFCFPVLWQIEHYRVFLLSGYMCRWNVLWISFQITK